ncbi:hypothetical protein NDU88_003757 [Pleurodeles waltl]|uniref:Uncharacterized protein n=1 Tax=Pleurodeles waltl TaxID=8319 RepID=A0AAV7MRI1_PLEWA|nr:hypothetical protein NDU88_003757 [Pleurodeles waltl]
MTGGVAEARALRAPTALSGRFARCRALRLGPKRREGTNHPRPIIACFLRHTQAQQLLQKECMQGPFRMNDLQIRMTADFSKETSECRKAFLALRPSLRQLEIKFGLFKPARMWITKNNVSKDFYDPMDLSLYLNSFSDRPLDTASRLPPQALITTALNSQPMEFALERPDHDPSETSHRGRDLERFSKNHNVRGQILHAVAKFTQVTDRDKSRSSLKPSTAPTREEENWIYNLQVAEDDTVIVHESNVSVPKLPPQQMADGC